MPSFLHNFGSARTLGMDLPHLTPTLAEAVLGALVLGYSGVKLFGFLALYLRSSSISKYCYSSEDGKQPWALVTGASDGIGKALCRQLAGRGFNVILHGRNPTKLAKVVAHLEKDFPARDFKTAIVDASRLVDDPKDRTSLDPILAVVKDLHLTVLVNNAGSATFPPLPVYNRIEDIPTHMFLQIVSTNALFPTMLFARLLPQLSSAGGPALVLSLSSLSDVFLPLISVYAASKTFTASALRTAARELDMSPKRQVQLMNLRIGHVTGVSGAKKPATLFLPDATTIARACLARVGCGEVSVIPWWPHALQSFVMQLLPESVKNKVFINIMSELRDEELTERKQMTEGSAN
jgi:17beta-estradiol 17-dehydrogenase / very-long-chain 3-oxoacyl-CoA reductase